MLKIKLSSVSFHRSFYNLVLGVATLVVAPIILFKYLFFGKYKGILLKRLGLVFDFPSISDTKPVFWVHGVSLGEISASRPFIEELKNRNPQHQIIVSTLTTTGFEAASKIKGVIPYLLPSDLWTFFVVKHCDPEALFLVEGDIWPNMVMSNRQVFVINGKISENTYLLLKKFPFIRKYLIEPIHFWAVQSEVYRDRLVKLDVPAHKIVVTGDLKGAVCPIQVEPFAKKGLLLVSTHEKEEELLLNALLPFDRLIMVAPRHPERFSTVEMLLKKMGVTYTFSSNPMNLDHVQVLLIDQMGVLPTYYSSAVCTIVAGSFIPKIGGHNLMEPILYGSIPLFGPWTEKQEHQKSFLQEHRIGICLSLDKIRQEVFLAFNDPNFVHEQQQRMDQARRIMQKPLETTLECLIF